MSTPTTPQMRERPLGGGLQDQPSNHLELPWSRARVVSVDGKVAARPRQVRVKKTNASEPLMTCRKLCYQHQNRDGRLAREEAQRRPAYWLGGVRHKGGVSLTQAVVWNVGTCRPDVKRRAQVEGLCEGASIDAGHRGGVARSSVEASESWRSQGAASFGRCNRSTSHGRSL